MDNRWKWEKWVLGALSGVSALLIAASATSFNQAATNLSSWAKAIGLPDLANLLLAPSVDRWGFWIGALALASALGLFALHRWRSRRRAREELVDHFFPFFPKQLRRKLAREGVRAGKPTAAPVSPAAARPDQGGGSGAAEQKPAPDWRPISEAVEHIATAIDETVSEEFYPRARAALRQQAADGKLHLRGCREYKDKEGYCDPLLQDIDRTYWSDGFELNALAGSRDFQAHDHTWSPTNISRRPRYWAVVADWNEYTALWPLRFKHVPINILVQESPQPKGTPEANSPSLEWSHPADALEDFGDRALADALTAAEMRLADLKGRAREPEQKLAQYHDEVSGLPTAEQAAFYDHWHGILASLAKQGDDARADINRLTGEVRTAFIGQLESGALIAKGFRYPDDHDGEIEIEASRWRNLWIDFERGTANKRHDFSVAFTEVLVAKPGAHAGAPRKTTP